MSLFFNAPLPFISGTIPFFGETEILALNPYLWLDASDSILTDKSSNNLTITNHNSGYVDNVGTQNGLSTAGNTNRDRRELRFAASSAIKTSFALVKGDSTWTSNINLFMWGSATTFDHHGTEVNDGTVIEDRYTNVETWSAVRQNGTEDAPWGASGNWGSKSTNWELYAFRTDDASTNWTFSGWGRDRTQSNRSFTGEVAELLIFEGFLSTSDIEKIEGYLMHKWGLEANLDVNHPYRSSKPEP